LIAADIVNENGQASNCPSISLTNTQQQQHISHLHHMQQREHTSVGAGHVGGAVVAGPTTLLFTGDRFCWFRCMFLMYI